LRSPSDPLDPPARNARQDIPLPLSYSIDLFAQKKPLVKVSLIIVKGLVTMRKASPGGDGGRESGAQPMVCRDQIAAAVRPTDAQRRYLERGLTQAGGKLSLFDREGREVPRRTVESCLAHGWAAPWTTNPVKPDWLVCRLTDAGYRVLGVAPPAVSIATEPSARLSGN
jgi:hypothetical protein